jgi:hypothetical protein
MGEEQAVGSLARIDEYYEDQLGPGGRRVVTQLAKQLAEPRPYDLDDIDLSRYRRLVPEWRSWRAVEEACRQLGAAPARVRATGSPAGCRHRGTEGPGGARRRS